MKKILIIGAGELQIPLIKICKEIKDDDVYVCVTDRKPNAAGFAYADDYRIVSALDKESIYQYAKEKNIDGIVTTSEAGLFAVSYVCERLNLPGLSELAARISNDKYLMREVMKNNGMKVPTYYRIKCLEDLSNIIDGISFPIIVKPTSSSGSIGVIFVKTKEDFKNACKFAFEESGSSEIILEEYLVGKEYSVEALSQNGKHHIITITEKFLNELPYFVEQRHIVPANLSKENYMLIEEYVSNFLDICGINNSASHTELKLTENGPIIIETGARIGGDQITADLVPLATGVSMHENIARIALGLDLNIGNRICRYSGIQFIMNENYSKIIDKLDYLKSRKEIVKVIMPKKRHNSTELVTTNSSERDGYYLAVADSRQELLNILDIE